MEPTAAYEDAAMAKQYTVSRQERTQALERSRAVSAAVEAEHVIFNAKVFQGAEAILHTAFGPYVVASVDRQWNYRTYPVGRGRNWLDQRTFAGCNNDKWADLLRQVGVERHPLFAAYA
jgi:hypothetical protein